MAEPMSDERLAQIRADYTASDYYDEDKVALLAEVERLAERLSERDVDVQLNVAAHMYEVRRRASAEAALARVHALHTRLNWTCAGCGLGYPCATIRAVATDEQ